jgi:hypothetical protein
MDCVNARVMCNEHPVCAWVCVGVCGCQALFVLAIEKGVGRSQSKVKCVAAVVLMIMAARSFDIGEDFCLSFVQSNNVVNVAKDRLVEGTGPQDLCVRECTWSVRMCESV